MCGETLDVKIAERGGMLRFKAVADDGSSHSREDMFGGMPADGLRWVGIASMLRPVAIFGPVKSVSQSLCSHMRTIYERRRN